VRFLLVSIVFIGLLTATREPHQRRNRIFGWVKIALSNRYSPTFRRSVVMGVIWILLPVVLWGIPPTYSTLDSTVIRRIPLNCNLFSTDSLAGAVLLVRPDVPIWIDGRLDYWGRERLIQARDYFELRDPARLVPDGSECVLLPKEQRASKLVLALNRNPSWTRVTSDPTATLWVKST